MNTPDDEIPEARVVERWRGKDGSLRVAVACPYGCVVVTGYGRSRRVRPRLHIHGEPGDGGSMIRNAHCAEGDGRFGLYRIVVDSADDR